MRSKVTVQHSAQATENILHAGSAEDALLLIARRLKKILERTDGVDQTVLAECVEVAAAAAAGRAWGETAAERKRRDERLRKRDERQRDRLDLQLIKIGQPIELGAGSDIWAGAVLLGAAALDFLAQRSGFARSELKAHTDLLREAIRAFLLT